jgi:hypothetical protein
MTGHSVHGVKDKYKYHRHTKLSHPSSAYTTVASKKNGRTLGGLAHQSEIHIKNDFRVVYYTPRAPASTSSLQSATGSPVEFEIIQSNELWKKGTLEYNCTNTAGGATVTPAPAAFFCSRIEVAVDGGSTLVQTLYDDAIYVLMGMLHGYEQLQYLGRVANFNPDITYTSPVNYGAPTAIAASGTATYYQDIIGILFQQANGHFPLSALGQKILLRLYFQDAQEVNATLRLDSVRLVISSEQLPDGEYKELADYMRKSNFHLRYLDQVRVTVGSKTFTAGTENINQLSGAQNIEAAFWFGGLRSSLAIAAGAKRTYAQITGGTWTNNYTLATKKGAKYWLTNNDGQDITGGSGLDFNFLRWNWVSEFVPGQIFAYMPLLFAFHGNPVSAMLGVHDGSFKYTSYENLVIYPDSTFTSGTYDLTLIFFVWKELVMDGNGEFKMLN